MRNPISMLQQLNWMRMEIACGSLSDLTGWLKRWCSFCREWKSLCLPLSACQCNYNHMGTRGGPWYPVDYSLNNMLEMRSVSLGLLCPNQSSNVCMLLYLYCEMKYKLHILISKSSPEKPNNKSFVWLIHYTNFGLICTQRLIIWSSSKIAPVEIQFLSNPTHSFSVSQNFNAFFKLPIRPSSKRGIWGPIAFSHSPPLRCQAFRWNYRRGFCHSVAIGWVAALYNSCKAHMIRHQQVCVCERDKERVKGSERGGGMSRLMFNTKWDCLHLLPQEP